MGRRRPKFGTFYPFVITCTQPDCRWTIATNLQAFASWFSQKRQFFFFTNERVSSILFKHEYMGLWKRLGGCENLWCTVHGL